MSSSMWLSDGSRYDEALDRCRRSRFLGFHFGPTGYGIAKRAQSIPLSTGISYHDILAPVLDHVRRHDTLPPDAVVREACASGTAAYRQLVEARGLTGLGEDDRLEEIITEQEYLIQGLVWAFALTTLPWIHEQCRVIEVEQEAVTILGCTCGLGDQIGTLEEHEARDCQGMGWQTRADFLTEYRARPGVYALWDFKGSAYGGYAEDWETKRLFAMPALDLKSRGIEVSEAWVVELLKGKRQGRDYDYATKTQSGPQIQNSTLCYWYRREGNPPLDAPDWQEQYEYQDAEGKNRRLGNNYRKTGLWLIPQDMPEIAQSGLSIPEFTAKFLPKERLGKHVSVIGPLQIHPVILSELPEEILHEEQRWQAVCWELWDVLQNEAGGDWTHQSYQSALNRLVPRNFNGCRRYGKRHECAMADVCHQREGWQRPLESGAYVYRSPHHAAEAQQMVARGIVTEAALSEQEER